MKFLLDEIDSPHTEIFPKQDSIQASGAYGNFINAPIFGKHAPNNKTVFMLPNLRLYPYSDQWSFLRLIKRNTEKNLEIIIEDNDLEVSREETSKNTKSDNYTRYSFGLPICTRRMLNEGVTFDQRIACFRLAVNLKGIGFPLEITIGALINWRLKNKPTNNKRVITPDEIVEQVKWAYSKDYKSYGCKEPIIKNYCNPNCSLLKYANGRN